MNISKHAMQRYAERIMEKDDRTDVAVFVNQHKEKIEEDISKMVEYGELIYTGKSLNEFNKQVVNVYLKDCWVIISDTAKDNIITLYSIDLGLGKEFNEEYLSRMKVLIKEAQDKFDEENKKIETSVKEYQQLIEDNKQTIIEYNKLTKSLEEQNKTYQELIFSTQTNLKAAEMDVREIVGKLIGKKVF